MDKIVFSNAISALYNNVLTPNTNLSATHAMSFAIGSTDPVIWNKVTLTPLDPVLQKVGGPLTPLTPWFRRHC